MTRMSAMPKLGKDNYKERLDGIRYLKEGGLSECIKRSITIFDSRFYRRRHGTYTTITRGPAQRVTSINIGGEINPHQVNIINTDRLRGIHDDSQYVFKPTICTFPLSLPFYKQVYAIIKALREYSPNARDTLQHNNNTRIMCIILIQAHISAQWKRVGTQGCLGEFKTMVNQLTAKKCENISHIEVHT